MKQPIYGPRKVTQVYQVAVPARLLREAGLDKGSEVSFALSADDPTMICLFAAAKSEPQQTGNAPDPREQF